MARVAYEMYKCTGTDDLLQQLFPLQKGTQYKATGVAEDISVACTLHHYVLVSFRA
jgi:hypothetical protein